MNADLIGFGIYLIIVLVIFLFFGGAAFLSENDKTDLPKDEDL